MRHAHPIALAILLAGAPACHKQSEGKVTFTHSTNGLRLSLPQSLPVHGEPQRLTAIQTTAGFKVTLGGEAVRRVAIEATVTLDGGAVPAGAWPGEREVGGRRIHYRIDRAEGGSGGMQIDFHAWETCAGGHLEYIQGDLIEDPGEPDFSPVWTVIAGTQPPH